MSLREQKGSRRYWNAVGALWKKAPRQALWRAHSDAVNSAWIAAQLPAQPVMRLLKTDLFDEACEQGLYPLLAAHAHSFIGIDTSTEIIAAARARHQRLCAIVSDVRALPFADGSIDCVVSNSTLDHFPQHDDIARSLAELFRVLKPGGHLLITLDNARNPLVALRNLLPFALLNRLRVVPYYVGATCGPAQLDARLREAGYIVPRQADALLHCPRVLAVAAASFCERFCNASAQQKFLRALLRFERLSNWRGRYFSGYFVAIAAQKPLT